MAIKPLLLPRHTTRAGVDAVTLADGELRLANVTPRELRVGDGATSGGVVLGQGGNRYIREASVSAAATLDILITAADLEYYREFTVKYEDIVVATDDSTLCIRFGTSTGPTWQATGYSWGGRAFGPGGGADIGTNLDGLTGTYIPFTRQVATSGVGNAAGESCSGEIVLLNNAASPKIQLGTSRCSYVRPDGFTYFADGGGGWGSTSPITGVRLLCGNAGNLTGKAVLLGRRK